MKKTANKVMIISCYFGKFPYYFDIWLKSCESNDTIDFIIFTDALITECYPKNVKFVSTTLNEIKDQFKEKLGFPVGLNSPYKFCDFRPAYGYLFQDYLIGYDFWGHCDIDLVWGDIREFVTDEILNSFDKIFYWGHLSLYRNNDEINNAFKLEGAVFSYLEVFQNPENYAFDEITGFHLIAKKNGIKLYDKNLCANMTRIHSRMRLVENKSTKNYYNQIFYWEDGRIYRAYIEEDRVNVDEFVYLHFQWKNPRNMINSMENLRAFYILNDRFEEKQVGKPSIDEIIKLSNFVSTDYEKKEKKEYRKKLFMMFIKMSIKQKMIWIRQKLS